MARDQVSNPHRRRHLKALGGITLSALLPHRTWPLPVQTSVPATFPVNGVIKGWQEALVLMRPGAKWQLFIPPELAYGPTPRPKIPPNSLLIFDVTVLSAEAAPKPPALPGAPPAHLPTPGAPPAHPPGAPPAPSH